MGTCIAKRAALFIRPIPGMDQGQVSDPPAATSDDRGMTPAVPVVAWRSLREGWMRRREFIAGLGGVVALPVVARAHPARVRHVAPFWPMWLLSALPPKGAMAPWCGDC